VSAVRSPWWAKLLIAVGALLAVVSIGLIGAEKAFNARYLDSLHHGKLLSPDARNGTSLSGPLNFLLIGSDFRARNPGMGARSDTIIIVHVPATLDRAYLISIPRDLRVHIPPDPDNGFTGRLDKINASFQYGGQGEGGVQLLSETLTQLVGVRFDGAALVNFGGFDKVVEALGGVRLCVDEQVRSIHTGHLFRTGCQDLTAAQTLDYLRQRETLPGGDFDRQRHQQQFLQAIFAKTFANGLAQSPVRLDQIIRGVGSSMTVDTNGVPLDQLVFTLRNIRPSALVGVRLPSYTRTIGGISYVLPTGVAATLYAAIDDDTLAQWVAAYPSWVNPL
jgi:LCP family protein required for cell wall assembly